MASENAGDDFASGYWQRRPGLNFDDSENALPVDSSAVNDNTISSSFDYVHFVKFIALRSIPITKYEDLDFTIAQSKSIGSGAAMQVCMATLKTELVAVKQIRNRDPNIKIRDQGRAEDVSEKWLNDLYFEIQIMSHQPLCEHPNIVQLKGISFDETRDGLYPFLIVEPACEEYPDLTRLIRSSPQRLPAGPAADIIGDIADGISVLHVYGVIHWDIKPDNILIFKSAERGHGLKAKICDFGFSGSLLSEDSPRGNTSAWAAPEFQSNAPDLFKEYRWKSPQDVYSFALVAMFVLLGRPPIVDRDSEASQRMVSGLQPLTPEYPWLETFIPVIENCLEYDPSKRNTSIAGIRRLIV
ncbi:kinase-like protein [Cadophora sp. DSE1049]|nr:kinase-like protein [Cadophora sp. DSE1049]